MVCDEGKKHPWSWGLMCSGSQRRCEWCNQSVCQYHFGNNSDGSVGGHSDCAGPQCSSNFSTCSNTAPRRCKHCKAYYCAYHVDPVGSVAQLVGGHNCPSYTSGYAVAAVGSVAVSVTSSTARRISETGITGAPNPALLKMMTWARAEVNAMRIKEDHRSECPLVVLAQMAHNVYDLHEHSRIQDPTRMSPEHQVYDLDRDGWDVAMAKQQPDYSGYPAAIAYAVYVRERSRLAVLALKGTSPGSATDIHHDLQSIIAGVPPAPPLVELARVVKDFQEDGWKVMVTGHSLGGYMAEVVATTCGISGVGFCAPGSGWHKGNKGGEGSGFQNVNFEHDAAGNVMPGMFEHVQWSVYVQDLSGYHHGMGLMLKCMANRRRNGWTNQNVVSRCQGCATGYYTCA